MEVHETLETESDKQRHDNNSHVDNNKENTDILKQISDEQSNNKDIPSIYDQDKPQKDVDSDSQKDDGPPYSILVPYEKTILSILLGFASLISGLSMPIYLPILTLLEAKFQVTSEQINLSLVSYQVLQAVSPVLVSSLADTFGRRPILLISCLLAAVVNIGLAVCNAYWLLLFLRCCLAASAAPTIAVTNGAVGDWVQRHERARYVGIVSAFTLIGMAFSPFLGSVINVWLGWRGIFWFCALVDFLIFISTFIFIPETKRSLVGNLSCEPLNWFNKSPIVYYYRSRLVDKERSTINYSDSNTFHWLNFIQPLIILFNIEVLFTLLPACVLFAAWNTSLASFSTGLAENYGLSTLKIGICYFVPGMGSMIGSITAGRYIDYFYKRDKRAHQESGSNDHFNIIKSRISKAMIPMGICMVSLIGFGWSLQYTVNLAVVLVFEFLISLAGMYPMTCTNTLVVDLFPSKASMASSLMNLLRCGISSIFIACLDKMLQSRLNGYGGTYTLLASLCFLFLGMYGYLLRHSSELSQRSQHTN